MLDTNVYSDRVVECRKFHAEVKQLRGEILDLTSRLETATANREAVYDAILKDIYGD